MEPLAAEDSREVGIIRLSWAARIGDGVAQGAVVDGSRRYISASDRTPYNDRKLYAVRA